MSPLALTPRFKKIACFASAVVLLVLELIRRRRARPRGVPVVPGHWLLGNVVQLARAAMKNQHYEFFYKVRQDHGPTVAFKTAFDAWIVHTSCPRNVKHILKTNFSNYPKGSRFQARLHELLGTGIFNADGEAWHQQRKVSSQMFTAKLFKEHIWLVVRRNARKLRDVLESNAPDKPVDVFNLMNRFTLDTISEIGFGKCIGSLEDPSSPFLKSFDKAQQISIWRFLQPHWRLLRFLRLGTERDTREHFGLLDAYSRQVVRDLCDAVHRGTGKGGIAWADIEASKSFVGLFLEDAKKRGESLNEDYLRDLVLNFLIAGRDTTAQGLSWTIYCLAQHPDVEAKAREEVVDICGVRGPSYQDIPRLQYLNAVISEALRLFPSVPIDVKQCLCDDTLPDGTFVPKGSQVEYDIYSMGRDRTIWGEDAEVFRPERWLERDEPPTSYEYLVFNAGPRECLGKRLAIIEMKACLATLLPQMSFQLAVPSAEIVPDTQLTIGMGNGLPCFVKPVGRQQRLGSNASTGNHSECDSVLTELTGASTEDESHLHCADESG